MRRILSNVQLLGAGRRMWDAVEAQQSESSAFDWSFPCFHHFLSVFFSLTRKTWGRTRQNCSFSLWMESRFPKRSRSGIRKKNSELPRSEVLLHTWRTWTSFCVLERSKAVLFSKARLSGFCYTFTKAAASSVHPFKDVWIYHVDIAFLMYLLFQTFYLIQKSKCK